MVSAMGGSEDVATYIKVDNGNESCVCSLASGTADNITCRFYRTDCPLSQDFVIN